jgi:hypothetical protein
VLTRDTKPRTQRALADPQHLFDLERRRVIEADARAQLRQREKDQREQTQQRGTYPVK